MLKSLTVSNYRSLGHSVRIPFGRLTALVGPNGAGKSNVMDVLRFVADAMHGGLEGAVVHHGGIDAIRRWSGGHPFEVDVELDLDLGGDTSGRYAFVITGERDGPYRVASETAWLTGLEHSVGFQMENGVWKSGPPGIRPSLDRQSLALPLVGGDTRFLPLLQALQSISVYSIVPDTLRVPQKHTRPRKPMDRHGENWVSVLKDQPEETWKPELVSALYKLTGDIEDIEIESVASYLVVRFRHHSEGQVAKAKWFEAAQESDGTLRVAGLITALLQEPSVPVIGIEEPELTVHPGAIPLLYDYLHQASDQSQVIITTHSPEMLDLFDVDDVRVVERRDGVTRVQPIATQQKDAVRKRLLTLGELLREPGLMPADDDMVSRERSPQGDA